MHQQGRIRAQARDAYNRELNLDNRIQYVHDYLMAKVWYVAQIFPPPDDCVRKLNTSVSWFIWKGDIFRVPLPTLQRRKEEVGWGLNKSTGKESSTLPLPDADTGPAERDVISRMDEELEPNGAEHKPVIPREDTGCIGIST